MLVPGRQVPPGWLALATHRNGQIGTDHGRRDERLAPPYKITTFQHLIERLAVVGETVAHRTSVIVEQLPAIVPPQPDAPVGRLESHLTLHPRLTARQRRTLLNWRREQRYELGRRLGMARGPEGVGVSHHRNSRMGFQVRTANQALKRLPENRPN